VQKFLSQKKLAVTEMGYRLLGFSQLPLFGLLSHNPQPIWTHSLSYSYTAKLYCLSSLVHVTDKLALCLIWNNFQYRQGTPSLKMRAIITSLHLNSLIQSTDQSLKGVLMAHSGGWSIINLQVVHCI